MKTNSRNVMLVFCLMVAWGVWGCAEPPDTLLYDVNYIQDHPRIEAYLSADEQLEGMKQVGDHWDKLLYDDRNCTEEARIKPIALILQEPIVFPEDGEYPIKGSWRQRYYYERCNREAIYNAVFVAEKGSPPQVVPDTPGNSNASMRLIRDSMKHAKAAAYLKLKSKECPNVILVEATVVLPPEIKDKNGRIRKGLWIEEWTLDACGQKVSIFGLFVPNGRGGTGSSFQ